MTAELAANVLTMAQTTAQTGVSGFVKVYTKQVGGLALLFGIGDDGIEYQLTPVTPLAGTLNYSNRDILLTLGSNTLNALGTAQSLFTSTRDAVTLASSSRYLMRANLALTTATSGANFALVFNGGSATFNSFNYVCTARSYATLPNSANAPWLTNPAVAASTIVTTGTQTTLLSRNIQIDGLIDVNAGGTFIPQITWQATLPGGSTTVQLSAYMELILLGTSSFTQQGGWA